MRWIAILAVMTLAAQAADDPKPLERGKEVVFTERQGSLPFIPEAAIRFKVIDGEEPLATNILSYAPFIRAVREYRELRDRVGTRQQPIYLVFEPSMERTAYCAEQPFLLNDPSAPKGQRGHLVTAPLIHVTGRYLDDMKKGKAVSVLCHEIGHAFMSTTHGMFDYPANSPEFLIDFLTEEGHWYEKETDPAFAYSEGWAEFTEYHYTGEALPDSLVQMKEDGKARPLTASEIRRREGAQAYLLLCLDRDAKVRDFYDRALEVMTDSKPQSTNGLLRAYVKRHPDVKEEIEKTLSDKSGGVFAIDYDYSRDDYWQDVSPNWQRFWDKVKEKLR